MSEEARRRISERMRQNNPMKRPEVAQRAGATNRERNHDKLAVETKRRRANGSFRPGVMTQAGRDAIAKRMRENNPMRQPAIVDKMRDTAKRTGHYQRAGERMRQAWADGRITPHVVKKGINKTEARLLEAIRPLGFRFVGDGTFWLKTTASGVSRNPDFIWQSGKRKTALLLNAVYYHTVKTDPETELHDYRKAGWNIFVLWLSGNGGHLPKYLMPAIVGEIGQWLAGLQSQKLKRPDIHQFSTSNAGLIITSSPPAS